MNGLHLLRKYAWIFVRGHYLSFEEQIQMSARTNIRAYFRGKWELLSLSSRITRAALKIGEYYSVFRRFSWGIFSHLDRLN